MEFIQFNCQGCEVKAAAALIASARLWFGALRNDLMFGPNGGGSAGDQPYCIAVIAFRQDATSSKLKQCHMEVECGVMRLAKTGAGDREQDADMIQSSLSGLEITKYISDVIPVQEGTALATVGMSLKMLESLGCPTWRELSQKREDVVQRLLEGQADSLAGKSVEEVQAEIAKMLLGHES